MEHRTPVLMRKWHQNNGVIAIFPSMPGDGNADLCAAFEVQGGFTCTAPLLTLAHTTEASVQEYQETWNQLERSFGYRLKLRHNLSSKDARIRISRVRGY